MNVIVRQGTAGSLWLCPEIRRTSPVVATPTPVLTTSPVGSVPSPPSQGASVFSGTPPVSPPSSPPASVFARPSLAVQIAPEPNPVLPITPGQPFRFYIRLTNTGTTDASNVTLLVPLPEEFRGRRIDADWSTDWETLAVERRSPTSEGKPAGWEVGIDNRGHQAALQIPLLSPGKTAYLLIEYPDIDSRGHNITCTVYAGEERITQGSQQIVP
jgi:hypothetical protein